MPQTEPSADSLVAARSVREIFESFLRVGFEERQAFILTIEVMRNQPF